MKIVDYYNFHKSLQMRMKTYHFSSYDGAAHIQNNDKGLNMSVNPKIFFFVYIILFLNLFRIHSKEDMNFKLKNAWL
jgi:hypothetical protein